MNFYLGSTSIVFVTHRTAEPRGGRPEKEQEDVEEGGGDFGAADGKSS